MSAEVRRGLRDLAAGAAALEARSDAIAARAARFAAVLRGGGTLFFAGNGGSAAHAQHMAAEYLIRFRGNRRAFRAVALAADGASLTAAGNDLGFEQIYARQIEGLARPGDLVCLISTSGQSDNLLEAARAARRVGVTVVGLLGRGGGALAGLVDEVLLVPGDDTARIQELQLFVDHAIVELVEKELGP